MPERDLDLDRPRMRIDSVDYTIDSYEVAEHYRDINVTYGRGQDVDWTAGLGHGYTYSDGFDASLPQLRLSPHRITLAVPELTEKHAGLFEAPKSTGTVTAVTSGTTKAASGDLTLSYTVASGSDRILIVGIGVDVLHSTDYSDETTWPTFGGVRMHLRETSVSTTDTLNHTPGWMLFYLVNPTVSTADIFWTNPDNTAAVMIAANFTGVLQVDPFGPFVKATASSAGPATVTASPEFDLVIDIMACGNTTATVGASQTQLQNDIQGTAVRLAMSTQPNTADGVMSWTLGGSVRWRSGTAGLLAASSGTFIWTHEDEYIHKHTISSTATAEGAITEVTAPVQYANAEFAGRATQWLGEWQVPAGASVFTQRLSAIGATTDTWTANNWYAVECTEFQDGATPEIAAGLYGDGGTIGAAQSNRLATAASTSLPILAADFSEHGLIGDKGLDINAVVETGGFVLIAKEDCLFEIDRDQVARPVVPKLSKGNTDQENGKYTTMWGDICLYPRQDALWGYLVGRESFKMGVEALIEAGLIPIDDRIITYGKTSLHGRRPYSPVLAGAGFYYCQATSTTTGATIYSRKRRDGDPPGLEFLTHMLWDGDRWKGGLWDSNARLITKEATSIPANRGLTSFHTNPDGSPNTATRRGDVSTSHVMSFPVMIPKEFRTTQLRSFEVDLGGDWNTSTDLTLTVYRDEDTSTPWVSNNNGTLDGVALSTTPISTAGIHIVVPTVGTRDTASRWYPVLDVTTDGSYAPLTQDAYINSMRFTFRTPQLIRVVIPAEDEDVAGDQANYNAWRKKLQGLVSQGPVTIHPPAGQTSIHGSQYPGTDLYGTSYSGEITSCRETVVRGKRVFIAEIQRLVTD